MSTSYIAYTKFFCLPLLFLSLIGCENTSSGIIGSNVVIQVHNSNGIPIDKCLVDLQPGEGVIGSENVTKIKTSNGERIITRLANAHQVTDAEGKIAFESEESCDMYTIWIRIEDKPTVRFSRKVNFLSGKSYFINIVIADNNEVSEFSCVESKWD